MIELRQSTAGQEIPLGFFLDSTNGDTEETGLSIAAADIWIWKWGATTLSIASAGATHILHGIYYTVLDADDTDTMGAMKVYVHEAGALVCVAECAVVDANYWDSKYSTDRLEVDVLQLNGVGQSLLDLVDFTDTGYNPATHKVAGITGHTAQSGDSYIRTKAWPICTVETGSTTTVIQIGAMTPSFRDSAEGSIEAFVGGILFFLDGAMAGESQRISDYDAGGSGHWDITVDTAFSGSAGVGDKCLLFPFATNAILEARLTSARAGYLDELAAANLPSDVDTLLTRIGTPANIDTGGASLAENIKKLADDNAGADFDAEVHSLKAIRVRGDAAWTTGGGGAITQILNVKPIIPNAIDLANTATVRLALGLVNAVDDLPTAAEITPGTITIDRKAIGGTAWSNVVNAAACSEVDGVVYYDEVFDAGTGYVAGDSIRVTFKSQKITADANDMEITGTDGWMFQTFIREAVRGTDSAALASVCTEGRLVELDGANLPTDIGTVDTVVDAIKAKTDNLPGDPASETNVDANETKIDTIDTVVDAIKAKTDNLPGSPAAVGSLMGLSNDAITSAKYDESSAHPVTTAMQKAGATIKQGTVVADGGNSTTQFKTDLTETTNDHYKGREVIFISGDMIDQASDITGYTGATTIIAMTAMTETPGEGDTFVIV